MSMSEERKRERFQRVAQQRNRDGTFKAGPLGRCAGRRARLVGFPITARMAGELVGTLQERRSWYALTPWRGVFAWSAARDARSAFSLVYRGMMMRREHEAPSEHKPVGGSREPEFRLTGCGALWARVLGGPTA